MEQNKTPRKKRKTVVAVRFSALGDVAMTLPALYSAAEENPDVRFIFLTRPLFAKFAVNPPENLEIKGVDLNGEYKGVAGMYRLARRIVREFRADVLVDLHDVLRTKMLRGWVRLAGKKVSVVDKGRKDKKSLTALENKQFRQLRPMPLRYADAIKNAGIEVGDNFRSVFDKVPSDPALYSSVAGIKGKEEKRVGIAPFAKHPGKTYSPEKMEKVVAGLSGIPGVGIFLFGGGAEEEKILGEWERKYPRTVSLAGKKLGFPAELSLMDSLDVMVTMDSGNMHLASLAGTPVVSIWGATHPFCGFLGFGQSPDDIVQLEMPCRPCSVFGDKKCVFGNYKCLNGIETDVIFNKISQKLDN